MAFEKLVANLGSIFTAQEVQAMRDAGKTDAERESAFRRFWSLKEALVKARGDGLGFELSRSEFTISKDECGWTATVAIDGIHRPRWKFFLQEMAAGHWISVSRGPPEDIVDAWGEFTLSLKRRFLTDEELRVELEAPNPPFSLLTTADLVPEHLLDEYGDIVALGC